MSRPNSGPNRELAGKLLSSGLVILVLSLVGVQTGLPFIAIIVGFAVSLGLCILGALIWFGASRDSKKQRQSDDRADEHQISDSRYAVALTFPGEFRPIVGPVAEHLATELGRSKVFYDEFFSAELARPNLDTYLQRIYSKSSELVVVFLCSAYKEREWCGIEFRAVREMIKNRHDNRIMLVRFDEGPIDGILQIDGYLDASALSPEVIAERILKRYRRLDQTEDSIQVEPEREITVGSAINRLRRDVAQSSRQLEQSVCLNLLSQILKADYASYSLLTARESYDFAELCLLFRDADSKLFESDQAIGGRRHSLYSMAIYFVGAGLARLLEQSNAAERLLLEMSHRMAETANIDQLIDVRLCESLYAACTELDSDKAARLLDAEFDD